MRAVRSCCKIFPFRNVARAVTAGVFLVFALGCGMTKQSDQQLQQQTAASVGSARQELNEFSSLTKKLVGGGSKGQSSATIVNLNYSDEQKLESLPGITPALAKKIINNRPYNDPTDLVAKHVLTKEQFAQVKGRAVTWDNLWTGPG